ncbi:MAG: D-alanyl-D-alanine carboxypeptidase family protein [Oscillospiraceae bacterium]|nr:D-alanyl-D-alanine carboxypeptidase family protein [Oscillospiraceae bacterium]
MITLTVYKHRRRRRYSAYRSRILKLLLIPIIILLSILIYRVKFFTIVDGDKKISVVTFANSYLDELSKRKITIGNQDETSIDVSGKIKNGSTLNINRNCNIEIIYEGKIKDVNTSANTLLDVLKENGLPIKNTQVFNPADLTTKPKEGMRLVVDNIETKQVSKDETTINPNDPTNYIEVKQVVYEQTYKNGILIDEKKINEKITSTKQKFQIVTPSKDPYSIYVLVNKDYKLDKTFTPKNLVKPEVQFAVTCSDSENLLTQVAATALKDMFSAAKLQNCDLYMLSGYRSYETQGTIYSADDSYTNQPGASEHQTGLAVDIVNDEVSNGIMGNNLASFVDTFKNSKEGQWLLNNSYKYGFVLRYPEETSNLTGISFEPWHFRYVGIDLAKELHELNETIEDYSGFYDNNVLNNS